jgi:hypothetical protein
MVYAQGERVHMIEGSPVLIRPFAILVYNPQRTKEVLPERVERRSAIFDLASLSSRRTELRRRIAQLTGASLWPRLPVREWAAKVNPAYSAEQIEFLAQLEEAIAPSNTSSVTDPISIWHFSKGYEALLGDWRLAAYWAVHDIALALESRGLAYNDWRERLYAVWTGMPMPQPKVVEVEPTRTAEIEERARRLKEEVERAKLEELQRRLSQNERANALKALLDELERDLRNLPALAVAIFDHARKMRRLVLESGWRLRIEQQVRGEALRQGWPMKLAALRAELKRKLTDAEIEFLAEKAKGLRNELEAYRSHLEANAARQMDALAELARRRALTGASSAGPHFRTDTRQRQLVTIGRHYSREDVEAIEQANEELLSPAAPPELITDPVSGRRYWLWPDGRTSPA